MEAKPIINRVDNSGLKLVDFSEITRNENIQSLDLVDWLFKGLIVKEDLFKEHLENLKTEDLQGASVFVFCSKPVIIPQWCYMLVARYLSPICKNIVWGDIKDLKHTIVLSHINSNIGEYKDERVIVKGCGEDFHPNTYFQVADILVKEVKSLMYGEACSAVPIFKRK